VRVDLLPQLFMLLKDDSVHSPIATSQSKPCIRDEEASGAAQNPRESGRPSSKDSRAQTSGP